MAPKKEKKVEVPEEDVVEDKEEDKVEEDNEADKEEEDEKDEPEEDTKDDDKDDDETVEKPSKGDGPKTNALTQAAQLFFNVNNAKKLMKTYFQNAGMNKTPELDDDKNVKKDKKGKVVMVDADPKITRPASVVVIAYLEWFLKRLIKNGLEEARLGNSKMKNITSKKLKLGIRNDKLIEDVLLAPLTYHDMKNNYDTVQIMQRKHIVSFVSKNFADATVSKNCASLLLYIVNYLFEQLAKNSLTIMMFKTKGRITGISHDAVKTAIKAFLSLNAEQECLTDVDTHLALATKFLNEAPKKATDEKKPAGDKKPAEKKPAKEAPKKAKKEEKKEDKKEDKPKKPKKVIKEPEAEE